MFNCIRNKKGRFPYENQNERVLSLWESHLLLFKALNYYFVIIKLWIDLQLHCLGYWGFSGNNTRQEKSETHSRTTVCEHHPSSLGPQTQKKHYPGTALPARSLRSFKMKTEVKWNTVLWSGEKGNSCGKSWTSFRLKRRRSISWLGQSSEISIYKGFRSYMTKHL